MLVGLGKPKFVEPVDKHNVNEGETAFITFRVEGDPVPQVEWFKNPEKDMSCNPRSGLLTKMISKPVLKLQSKFCLEIRKANVNCTQ